MVMNPCSRRERAQATVERELQVMQRPGCSSLATSVSTLTVGSQATAILLRSGLRGACLVAAGGGRLRASLATGTRTSTDLSVMLSTFSEIVRVGAIDIDAGRFRHRLEAAGELLSGGKLHGAKGKKGGQRTENYLGNL